MKNESAYGQFKPQYDKHKAKYENLKGALHAISNYCAAQKKCNECVLYNEVLGFNCKGGTPCWWDLDCFDDNIESYIRNDVKEELEMGMNFYLWSPNRDACDKHFSDLDYYWTDTPSVGHQIHIAKTSMGWLPLFEAHKGMESVKDLEPIYKSGDFEIYDEDGNRYNWDEFTERVLKHNGGVQGAIPYTSREIDTRSLLYDKNMPGHIPVSHFEYANGRYADEYFKDDDGYEFTWGEFS